MQWQACPMFMQGDGPEVDGIRRLWIIAVSVLRHDMILNWSSTRMMTAFDVMCVRGNIVGPFVLLPSASRLTLSSLLPAFL